MSTLLQLRTEVLAYGFDTNQYSARIDSWLNEAQNRIARSAEVPQLWASTELTTAAADGSVILPADFLRMSKVYHQSLMLDLMPIDIGELRQMTQGGITASNLSWSDAQTGMPEVYAIAYDASFSASGIALFMAPVPDGAYTLTCDYYRRPTSMTVDGSVPDMPIDYQDLLVSYALSRCYRSEDDSQMSQFYQQEFQRDLAQYRNDLQAPSAKDGPKVIGGTWGDYY